MNFVCRTTSIVILWIYFSISWSGRYAATYLFQKVTSYLSYDYAGFLLIRTEILHAFLVQLLPVREVKFSQSGPMFVYELYRNGFLKIAQLYSQGVVHPNIYSVLQTCPSYRQVKRKLHSFQRFDKFARRDAFPSGRFRFPIWDSGKEECLFPP